MSQIAPPQPPPGVTLGDGDGLRRVHFRLWQIVMTAVTVFFTAWVCLLGPIPAIIALVVAKHVLVAILMMGLDMYPAAPAAPDAGFREP